MASSPNAGYWPSVWPGEDGGPTRRQAPTGGPGLDLQPDEQLQTTARDAFGATMLVHRDPGEVFAAPGVGRDFYWLTFSTVTPPAAPG